MNKVITVTFDGKVLQHQINFNLEINKEYQIHLINAETKSPPNDSEISAQLYAEIYE